MELNQNIIKTLKEKTSTKQEVFHKVMNHFEIFKTRLRAIAESYHHEIIKHDDRVDIQYSSKGSYDAKLKFGGDTLLFHMHTNVFGFEENHPIWKIGYVKEDPLRAYCGMINIYNFLSDSFKFNRVNDAGYLIARIFINKDNHFFVDGKRQMGFLFTDFANAEISEANIDKIIEASLVYSLDFDLLTPNYSAMQRVTINQIIELTKNMKLTTDKRLGFKYSWERNDLK